MILFGYDDYSDTTELYSCASGSLFHLLLVSFYVSSNLRALMDAGRYMRGVNDEVVKASLSRQDAKLEEHIFQAISRISSLRRTHQRGAEIRSMVIYGPS
jgi:hypothetical protein